MCMCVSHNVQRSQEDSMCSNGSEKSESNSLFFQINNTEFTVYDFTGDVQFSGLMSLNLIAGSLETTYLPILRQLRETLEMLET